jgi:dolichol-phosphate mannosyltransferase
MNEAPQSAVPSPASTTPPVTLSVAIPAYLEGEALGMILPSIKAAAAALTPDYEVLIVDTQEPMDNTAEVCRQNGVRHIHRSGGNSYGDAIRTLVAEARGRYILCMDADGSHSPSYFAAMWAERERYDITIGSRYVQGGHTENPLILIWMSYAVNLTFRLAFSIHAKDVTNSFRLYRREVISSMRLESNDFDILEEILVKAVIRRPPARIGEIPVTFARRKAGESKRKLAQFALGYLQTLKRLQSFARAAKQENKGQ